MKTIYEFEDGKIFLIEKGAAFTINIVHSDKSIANTIADRIINFYKNMESVQQKN